MRIEFESIMWFDVIDNKNTVSLETSTADGDTVCIHIRKRSVYGRHLKKLANDMQKYA